MTEASKGSEALIACAAIDPHVIVLDLIMPVMRGRDFLRAYRELPGHRARVVALSAMPQAREVAAALGCDAVLSKPFDKDELLVKVRALASTEPH